jgi:putative heme transporter
MFTAPAWLRDMGFASWLLVGFVLIVLGLVWLISQTAAIVMPVILAGIIGAVAGPVVTWLQGHRLPRAAGAGLVLLALALVALLVVALVVGGVSDHSADISKQASHGLSKIEGWFNDAGVDKSGTAEHDVSTATPQIIKTLLDGLAHTIAGLSSLAFFLAMTLLSTFFILKDAPVIHGFIDRHLGVPVAVANTITTNVATSLRNYFKGVTIIAAFNGAVIGLGALILGVPLAGTIAIVTFVAAYIPYIGAWTAGAFAVLLALGSQGKSAALILAVICLLANGAFQNVLQPFVFGATLSLNPLAVLIVTIGAGALFGMVGLTLAAPLTSAAVHISNELRSSAASGASGADQAPPAGSPSASSPRLPPDPTAA